MKDYREKLLQALKETVREEAQGAPVSHVFTEIGLFCDFDMPAALDPKMFEAVRLRMEASCSDCAYALSGFSGVYEDGDAGKRMLQRIYVTAFETQDELNRHKAYVAEAAAHDHKKLGAELDLFSGAEEIGAGLTLWHPKGAVIRHLLERFGQDAHLLNGYQWVYTPHIGKANLWVTSGHLDFYRDSMYSPMEIDGEAYYLKPMNCPFHIQIYKSRMRSYRDLPVRLAEYGTVYRYELSGALNGLTRVRGFTQDDAHIICTPDQIWGEVISALKFSLYVLRAFGLEDFTVYVSTRPEGKSIGTEGDWDMATAVLKQAVRAVGMDFEIDEGGGAFYGPKIDIKLKDVLGRQWQCSTIQFDFNLPARFGMKYTAADGKAYTPYMIHRALFGSIERFTALLTEHYKGEFPLWFAPVQFAIVPVNDAHHAYCRDLELAFKKRGYRICANYENLHMREKIRRFEQEKIPYIFVVGGRDIEAGGFSVRSRREGDLGMMDIERFLEHVREDLEMGVPRYILED